MLAVGAGPQPANAILFEGGGSVWTSSTLVDAAPAIPRLLPQTWVMPPGAALGTTPAIGDYSGDGLDDLAWRAVDGRVWVSVFVSVFASSSGYSTPALWGRLPPGTNWSSVRSGDFNADGRVDLVTRNPTTGYWRLLASTGTAFATSSIAGRWATNVAWTDVVQGDFDGDGGTDLAGRDPTTGHWLVSRGTPAGFETRFWGTMAASTPWQTIRAADFDGDGRTDLAARNPVSGVWRLFASDGTSFRRGEIRAAWAAGTAWTDVTVGDFDADGRADLAGRDPASQLWTVTRGSTAEFRTSAFGGLSATSPWGGFVAADFTGDGRTDLAARNAATGNWRMLPSTGTAFGRSMVIGSTPRGDGPVAPRPLRLAYERTLAAFDTAMPTLLADLSPSIPTQLVLHVPEGGYSSAPSEFTTAGNLVFFVADAQQRTPSFDVFGSAIVVTRPLGRELCVTDGTAAGTRLVRDIRPGGESANIWSLTAVGDRVFFAAADGTAGYQVWTSDGTEAGTFPIMDRRFTADVWPRELTAVGSTLFFVAYNAATSRSELWKSDGTIAGTIMVNDGLAATYPHNLTNVDGALTFTAYAPGTEGGSVQTIWQSDGTATGTFRIAHFPSDVTSVSRLVPAGGKLFAVAHDPLGGGELWCLDAGAAEARPVRDINPGLSGSSIASLTPLGGSVLFSADDGTTGPELWCSDGTADGTHLVLDIQPHAYDSMNWRPPAATRQATTRTILVSPPSRWLTAGSEPEDFFVFNGRLAFTAFDDVHGRQVWTTDGTAEGTWRLSDLPPVPAWMPTKTTGGGGRAWFAAVGRELYFTYDNLPISEWPGLFSASKSSFHSLWRSDGSPASAALIPGASVIYGAIPLAPLGTSLVFSGSTGGLNNEPWILTPAGRTAAVTALGDS